jgi:hypothetical protein
MSTAGSARPFRIQLGHWAAELLLVFLGAYAAFWLTGYQQHRQDARRRDQILESLEHNTKQTIANSEEQGALQDKRVAEFRRALVGWRDAATASHHLLLRLQRD